jgi:FkbM family methyltransferase
VTERLLQAGYTVYAFEPYGPSFERLQARLAGRPNLRAAQLAIGSADGETMLNVAEDYSAERKWDATLFNSILNHPMLAQVKFSHAVPVSLRSLESLQRSGDIPGRLGLLKIDAEGMDSEIIAGMGPLQAAIVMAEFWDREHPFGRAGHGRLDRLVEVMRGRGYAWHLVIYHLDPARTISYYCGRSDTVAQSWGNVVFFADHSLFSRAAEWCEAILPPTLHR